MQNGDRLWNKDFLLILLSNSFLQMGQQMTNTLVPKYVDALGASAYMVGLISSIFAVSALLIMPIANPAFDSFSKKKLFLAMLGGMVVTLVGYSLSAGTDAVIAFRVLHGICVGCSSTLSLAIASDTLSPQKLGRGISVFSLCMAAGQAIGPGLGLQLTVAVGYSYTFRIGAVIVLAAFLFALPIREHKEPRQPYRISLDKIVDTRSVPSAVLMCLLIIPYCCITSFLAIYADLLGVQGNIGLYFTVYALCLLLTRPISGVLIDKIGYSAVLIAGIVFFGISFVILSFSRTMVQFLVAAAVSALGYGICSPTIQYMCVQCAPRERRGVAISTNYLGANVGMILSTSSAGWIVDRLSIATGDVAMAYSSMYLIMLVPMAIALVYFLLIRKKLQARIASSLASAQSRA